MAITVDNSANGTGGDPTATLALTVGSGSNRYLLVGVYYTGGDAVTGVTYNSVAMTQLDKVQRGDAAGRWVYMYGLVAPSSGANNIVVSSNGGGSTGIFGTSYAGVNQTGQPDAHNTGSTASATSLGVAVTTVADNSWVTGMYMSFNQVMSAGAGTVSRNTNNGTGLYEDSTAPKTPAGSKTLTVSVGSADALGGVVVSLSPSTASASLAARKLLQGVGV